MGIGKQAKILNRSQVEAVLNHINGRRYGLRNQVIFLLSIRAGLRAKEIAALRWSMIVGADGEVGEGLGPTGIVLYVRTVVYSWYGLKSPP